jgi:hypothetical protein
MARPGRAGCHRTPSASGLEGATIVRTHGAAVRRQQVLSREQRQALRAIAVCRTPALGGHVDVCTTCGLERPAYHSCRNRHCPKCQSLAQARWIAQRLTRVLDTDYFHVVFTLPAALRPLALAHRRQVFALLLRAAAQTLLALGHDPQRLGAQLGITLVLHTWTRDLQFHPHVHCIVTAGGLAADGRRWIPAHQRHLFPVRVLAVLFRGKVLAALKRATRRGDITPAVTIDRTIAALYQRPWVVYVKRPFGGAARLFRYLGRYTHRVGLSNQRLVAITADAVTFRTKDGRTATLHPHEFLRRLLVHVLPAGFVKIRHAGLFAPRHVATALRSAQRLLARRAAARPAVPITPAPWTLLLQRLTGLDLTRCPRCQQPTLDRRQVRPHAERAPP